MSPYDSLVAFPTSLSIPHQPQQAPTSHKDSLVASPSTTQATPSTNESLRLVGCFFHLSLDHAGYSEHQWVFMTRWYLFSPLLQPCRSQLAPTSHNDSLVPFFTSPLTTQATTSTNESLWLIGAFFLLSLDHAGHNEHQWAFMARWLLFCFSLNHAGHTRHQRVITTRWLPFFASTSTITTISLVVVIKYKF